MADQRCGTCHWGKQRDKRGTSVQCTHPVPDSLRMAEYWHMRSGEGRTCPCYRPAPAQQPEETTDDE